MMNKILIIAAFACLAASQVVTECPQNNKDVMCIFVDEPVCGIKYQDNQQVKETFSNHCIACSYGKSSFTVEGRCEEFPSEASFCSPQDSKAEFCDLEFEPHCGWFNLTDNINGGNRCEACKNQNVLYTTYDECPLI